MFIFRNLRTGTGFLAIVALLVILSLHLGGCSSGEASPTAITLTEPPVLPVAEPPAFDFSFFDAAAGQTVPAAQAEGVPRSAARSSRHPGEMRPAQK